MALNVNEHILIVLELKEIKKLKGKKIITTNIYRMIGYGSIMYGYFCIGLIDFMLRVKT